MRESSKLMRWGLLVVLALCVVLMHHVPQQHEHDGAHSPVPVATQTVTMSEHHEAPAPEHGLLHLCLAVIAGFVALVLPFLQRIARSSAAAAGRPALSALERLRPPVPVPRRLAVLCVLRR